MTLYPLFLKLDGQRCLVVGAGNLGVQKASGLLDAGAVVDVVAPDISDGMHELAAQHDALHLHQRPFVDDDCAGATIVFSATAAPDVDAQVYAAGKSAGALVNVVDVKAQCDFYCGAQVRRGPVQLVIGTGGAAPAIARWLRLFFDDKLPPALGPLASAMGRLREDVLRRHPDFTARARLLSTFVHDVLAQHPDDDDDASHEQRIRSQLIGDA